MLYARPMLRIVPALLLIAAVGCDESPTGTGPEPRISVTDVTLEAVGDAAQLEAVVENSDEAPAWESLQPGVVTVSESGQAVAVAAGTATVRARIGTASGEGTILPPRRAGRLGPRPLPRAAGTRGGPDELRAAGWRRCVSQRPAGGAGTGRLRDRLSDRCGPRCRGDTAAHRPGVRERWRGHPPTASRSAFGSATAGGSRHGC